MSIFIPEKKIMTLEEAVIWRLNLKQSGLSLSVTNGCFDLLHRGHCSYLLRAREFADKLLVLMNSDESVRQLKGKSRPINGQQDRAYVLSCLQFVDAVVIFPTTRCHRELDALAPDVYAKGGDYTIEKLDTDERNSLLKHNTRIEFLSFVEGHSTTGMIERMQK